MASGNIMITTSQYRHFDRTISEHLKTLTALHIADVRGQHTQALVDATVVSWRNILVNLLELANPYQNYCLTVEQHAEVLRMVQDVTTSAGVVETLRERKNVAVEEGVGKTMMEVIDKRLDTAKENRKIAYETFHNYMLNLLDFGAEE